MAEPVTFELLLSTFLTIWIRSSPGEQYGACAIKVICGQWQDSTAMAELETILSSREPLYARADAVIDTSGSSIEVSLEQLLGTIEAAPRALHPALRSHEVHGAQIFRTRARVKAAS